MRSFFLRLALAAGMVVVTLAFVSSTHAQQPDATHPADDDRPPASPKQPQTAAPATPGKETGPSKSETEDALTFTGRVEREGGILILHDPVTKNTYRFEDPSRAQPYVGKQVKVTGKLDMNTNTIHISTIGPLL